MCARASAPPFLPHNSATIQFQVLMSMQMGAEFKKGADWYPFCLGGGSGRGVWGVGVPSMVPTPKVYVPSKK